MPLSRDKRFLYTRIAILVAALATVGFFIAGFQGLPFWYGGFVLCFWLAFGLLNYPEHSSLWCAFHRVKPFLLFYGALAGVAALIDQFGLGSHLWFYPVYKDWWMLWVYGALYPLSGLAALEMLYFLAHLFGEPLIFKEYSLTKWHGFFDVFEQLFLLLILAFILASVAGIVKGLSVPLAAAAAMLWLIAALIKLFFHIRHPGHYALVIALTVALAILSHELPNLSAREWVYVAAPLSDFFNALFLGLPVWVWFGWFLFVLVPLRLWIVLVLYPRVRG